MREAVIVDAVRTPVGQGKAGKGALKPIHPVDLLAHTLRALVERTGIDPAAHRRRHRRHRRPGRRAGDEHHPLRGARRRASRRPCPATTVDRQCGSSQQAVHFAAQGVIVRRLRRRSIACGVETMSRVPMWSNVPDGARPVRPRRRRALPGRPRAAGHQRRADRGQVGALRAPTSTASRSSRHRRAAAATDAGRFAAEIAPIDGLEVDESIRPEHHARGPRRPEARLRGPGHGRRASRRSTGA